MKTLKKAAIPSLTFVCVLLVTIFTITACADPTKETGEIQDFTVSYDVGDGSGIAPANQTVASGATINLPNQGNMTAPPDKKFNGWKANGQDYSAGDSFTVTANTIFLAQWIPINTVTFTVSYNAGTGSGAAPASQTVASGATISLPDQGSMTAPSGQTFNGWNTNGQDYLAGASFTVTGNTVFVAQWTAIGPGDDDSEPPTDPETGNFTASLLQAKPSPASTTEKPKVLASYSDGTNNFYLIDVGYISDMYISTIAAVDYTGVPVDFTKTITTTETYTTSMTKTISDSVTVSHTDGKKVDVSAEYKNKFAIGEFTAKGSFEWSWSDTTSKTNSKSTSNTATTATQYAESQTVKYQFGTNDHSLGRYRYALYGVSDVYFILETSLDNKTLLGWETNVCARPNDYFMRSEYAVDGRFTSEPTSTIDFKEDFWKNLEIPNIPDIPVLSFDTGGGTAIIPRNVSAGTPLPLAGVAAPTRTGYVFVGWDTHGYTEMPNESLTITAKWLALSVTVHIYDGNSINAKDGGGHRWTNNYPVKIAGDLLKAYGYARVRVKGSYEIRADAALYLPSNQHIWIDLDGSKIYEKRDLKVDDNKWKSYPFDFTVDLLKFKDNSEFRFGFESLNDHWLYDDSWWFNTADVEFTLVE